MTKTMCWILFSPSGPAALVTLPAELRGLKRLPRSIVADLSMHKKTRIIIAAQSAAKYGAGNLIISACSSDQVELGVDQAEITLRVPTQPRKGSQTPGTLRSSEYVGSVNELCLLGRSVRGASTGPASGPLVCRLKRRLCLKVSVFLDGSSKLHKLLRVKLESFPGEGD